MFSSCTKIYKNNVIIDEVITNGRIIATWITYSEINDLLYSVNSEKDFKLIVDDKISILSEYSINTIFLHIRAFDDAYYKSILYLVNKNCLDEDGNLKFDVLQTFIDVCKKYNIEIHGWINPYRIRNDSNVELINKHTLASNFINLNNDEGIIITENNIYYNPSNVEVQRYILNGVKEIIENYDVAGVHIDDYFYPTTSKEIDKKLYADYFNNGGCLSLDDYRRYNVTSLVSSIYTSLKSYDNDLVFSISPRGDIEQNYCDYYADVKLWLSKDGYADYIIPQIYFGYSHEKMPFEQVLYEWLKYDDGSKLVIGLGLYKSGLIDDYSSGYNEWIENDNVVSRQICDVLNNSCCGYSIFSASYLYSECNNPTLHLERQNIRNTLANR